MNRDEWNHVLDTESLTSNQRGAIMREFDRLGIRDRAERLRICASLLGLAELGSTSDLVMGQAGQLVDVLQRTADRAALRQAAAAPSSGGTQSAEHDGQDHNADARADRPASSGPITWPQIIARLVTAIRAAVRGDTDSSARGNSEPPT